MGIFNFNTPPSPPPDPGNTETAAASGPTPPAPVAPVPPGPPSPHSFDTSALTAPETPSAKPPEITPDPVRTLELKPKIVEQLVTVFDPEIPVNIYELGLIYDINVDKDGVAVIQMTLTAPNCPAAVTLPAEVKGKVKSVEGVTASHIDLVWEPPWDKDRMTDVAKLALGILD